MAVLNKDDFFNRLNAMLGDSQSDDAISFMEDMTDTYNSLEQAAAGDGENWEQRFRENDAAWRKKYKSRFFSSGGGNYDPPGDGTDPEPDPTKVTFADLFKRKE